MGAQIGRWLVVLGLGLAAMGGLIWLLSKALPLGRLPGDIRVEREKWSFYFPLATSLLISLLLTLILNLLLRMKR